MWWVVPEGSVGQIIDTFSWNGIRHLLGVTGNQAVWTVREANTKPAHAADVGPFTTKAEAQAAATGLNRQENLLTDTEQAGGVNEQPTATSLSPGNFLSEITKSSTIMRFAEGIIGIIVIAVSLDKLMDGNAGVATTIVKGMKLR